MKNAFFRKRVYWPWIYMAFLLVAAIIPLGNATQIFDHYKLELKADYLIHAVLYIPLPVIIGLSWRAHKNFWIRLLFTTIIAAILLECVQLLTPYRSFNVNDLWSNVAGVLIGLVPTVFAWRRFSST